MDVTTLQLVSLDAMEYFKRPFLPAASLAQTKQYMVMEVNPVLDKNKKEVRKGKYQLCDLEIVAEDDEMMDNIIDCRCHLGHLLKEGDYVIGYDLRSINFTVDTSHLNKVKIPDVVIVKKVYKNRRRRKWKLQTIAPHMDLGEKDKEEFMQDLEEDAEMRAGINIYKDDLESMSEATMEDIAPQIPLAEMLQSFHISEAVPVLDDEEEI
jgi:nonsense-mediated mRNA decay protein 3